MRIEHKQKLLFIGDSITDCDRDYPVGERGGLGNGYVADVDSLLSSWYPERLIRVLNTGVSGNRITDLQRRWQTDVLDHQPDWLAIMIGINDVWRQFDSFTNPDQVELEQFATTYRELLELTRADLAGLILITPFFLEPNRSDPMRAQLDRFNAVVRDLAEEFDAVVADAQKTFDSYLEHRPTQSLCGDRVHPNRTGHLIIARTVLTAVDFDWNKSIRGEHLGT